MGEIGGKQDLPPDPAPDARDRFGDRIYVAARRIGLDYGQSFALVIRARVLNDGVVEVFLRPSQPVCGPNTRMLLDVCGADAVFHGLIAALEGTSAERAGLAFVPVRIGAAWSAAAGRTGGIGQATGAAAGKSVDAGDIHLV